MSATMRSADSASRRQTRFPILCRTRILQDTSSSVGLEGDGVTPSVADGWLAMLTSGSMPERERHRGRRRAALVLLCIYLAFIRPRKGK